MSDFSNTVQALAVMLNHPIDTGELKAFCETEGSADSYETIKALQRIANQKQLSTMQELESLIIEQSLDHL